MDDKHHHLCVTGGDSSQGDTTEAGSILTGNATGRPLVSPASLVEQISCPEMLSTVGRRNKKGGGGGAFKIRY